ncbi:uncharacterized protein [Parasteatoda tepidariorum]|nr:uncharacterized protein LOC122269557 [Parasteatoda tepidariorum]
MSVPRIARIHLVYQFIILIFLLLFVFAISYNEVLLDKRILFLALIPIFCYQLLIVFCCTELLPLPTWYSVADDAQNEIPINHKHNSDNKGLQEAASSEVSKSPKQSKVISPTIPRARLLTKNKETLNAVSSSDANTQTNVSDIFKKAPIFSKASARRSESTKSYGFNQRGNNFEERFDSNENVRCFKTRNWRAYQDQKGSKSQSNLKSPSHFIEERKEATSPKLETLEESIESDLTVESDLSRSYSFPFRQRKHSRRMELEDNLNDLNIPVMPAWNAIDYFGPSNTNKRRKSISTEAIDRELRLISSHFEQSAKNDFTQSMEVARESVAEPVISTKRGLKSSASFNKWKQGFASYFNKPKRENMRTDDVKDRDNKKPFFKELFSSKEVLFKGPEKGTDSNERSDSPYPKLNNRLKISNRSPTYISYETDYFLD